MSEQKRLPRKTNSGALAWIGLLTWLVVIGVGMFILIDYSSAPGVPADVCDTWPSETLLERNESATTVLVFLHPRCPCSRATVTMLARTLASSASNAEVRALFFCPADEPSTWAQTDMWHDVERIAPGAAILDTDGRESELFGASTSGHVLVFDKSGQCVYSGGITRGRGHDGDNPGSNAVRAVLAGLSPTGDSFGVYGCPIRCDAQCLNRLEAPSL